MLILFLQIIQYKRYKKFPFKTKDIIRHDSIIRTQHYYELNNCIFTSDKLLIYDINVNKKPSMTFVLDASKL